MLISVKGICGESLLINTDSIEFAYEITMLDHRVMYIGMKSGKKLFLNITQKDFENLIKQQSFGVLDES